MSYIEEIPLSDESRKMELITFLKQFDLTYENDIDYSIAIYEAGRIVATASKAKNVLKCFAVDPSLQGLSITNSLIKKIEDRLFLEGYYHFFIFTTSCNKEKFTSIGYQEIITYKDITILENGINSIKSYLIKIKHDCGLTNKPKACIVMNGNPFTLGHRYLIETCAKENEEVIVLVVSEEKSVFPYNVRFKLIKEGTKDLANVHVCETGPYLVSNLSFPAYFLKEDVDIVKLQTEIDCQIFAKYYKPIFNINKRYIGTEPYCQITNKYNEAMLKILPMNEIEVKLIERLLSIDLVISASQVRDLLKEGKIEKLRQLVPKVTYNYLMSNEAKPIMEKINFNSNRH